MIKRVEIVVSTPGIAEADRRIDSLLVKKKLLGDPTAIKLTVEDNGAASKLAAVKAAEDGVTGATEKRTRATASGAAADLFAARMIAGQVQAMRAQVAAELEVRRASETMKDAMLAVAAANIFASQEAGKATAMQSDQAVSAFKVATSENAAADGARSAATAFLMLGQAQAFANDQSAKAAVIASTLGGTLNREGRSALFATLGTQGLGARDIAGAGGGKGGGGAGFLGGLLGGGGGGIIRGGGRGAGGLFFGGTIAGIAAWHVILDGIASALIAVGSAAMAATAGIAMLAPTARAVFTQMQSVSTVNSALQDQIPATGAAFRKVAEGSGMAAQGIEIYGGALNLLQRNQAGFISTGRTVADMFDNAVAGIVKWASTSGLTNKLLSTGVGFLHQFGQAAGYVGQALYNLVKAEPGVAHFLVDILTGVAKLAQVFTSLPAPILSAVLAIHGMYIWGRVLGAVLLSLTRGVINFAKSMVTLAANPLTWVALAAAAFAYAGIQASKASPSILSFMSAMETKLSTLPVSQALVQVATDIGALQQKADSLTLANANAQFTGISGKFREFGYEMDAGLHALGQAFNPRNNVTQFVMGLGHAFRVMASQSTPASVQMARDSAALNAEVGKMFASTKNAAGEIRTLMASGFSASNALGVMDLAGVRWNDTASQMYWKVVNLLSGYKAMSIQGALLANSVEAVNFAALQQQSKVQQLTQAWSAFFTTLTSGETGFVGFAQQVRAIGQAMAGGASLSLRNGLGNLSQSASAAAAAAGHARVPIMGLSSDSLQLRSAWLQAAQAGQAQLNNLTMMASASGLGAKGTAMLTQATKDMVAELLPAAKGSQALTAILYGLAQQGGYRGADSFKALAGWVGKVHDPMKNLDKITTILTVDMGNLSTDVHNLSVALGTTLNNAMSQAIFQARGGVSNFTSFAQALLHTGTQSDTTRTAANKLAGQLIGLTGNTTTAHREFDTFMIGLGFTKGAADRLWKSLGNVRTALGDLHSKTFTLTEFGTGKFNITGPGGQSVAGPGGRFLKGGARAAGGMITGGEPHRDSVLSLLTPGEVVVPEHMVRAGVVDHLRGRLPGFAAGGAVSPLSGNIAVDTGQATTNFAGQFFNQFTSAMESAMRSAVAAAMTAATAAFRGGAPAYGSSSAAMRFAQGLLPSYGWGGQWPALYALWERESGWNANAVNPSSGAYGIPQALGHGHPFNLGDYANQIRWGLSYIRGRYGSPNAAEGHEQAFGWYHNGLKNAVFTKPTIIGVGDGGPELVNVTPMRSRAAAYATAAGRGGDIYITVAGDSDPDGAARQIWTKLRDLKRHNGGQSLGL